MSANDYVARALRLRIAQLRKLLSIRNDWSLDKRAQWQNEIAAIEQYMREWEMPLAS